MFSLTTTKKAEKEVNLSTIYIDNICNIQVFYLNDVKSKKYEVFDNKNFDDCDFFF